MAMYRFGSAQFIEANINSEQWTKKVCCGKKTCSCGDGCRVKIARTIIAKYSPEKYMLSHVSIMAAVDIELADKDNQKSNYYIIPEYSKFVNNNGDAWTKEVLTNTYKTFIGADNFVEHIQLSSLSKGKVVDAALREVSIGKDRNGKDLSTFYVDLLVATDRKHKDLIRSIEAGEMNSLSMGCCPAGTVITLINNEKKVIEDVVTGDLVLTHENRYKRVTHTQVRHVREEVYKISVEGFDNVLVVTNEHPVYVYEENKYYWIPAEDLFKGTSVVIRSNEGFINKPVIKIEREKLKGKVYNFGVDEDNSYVANDYVVHNCKIAFSICSKCGNKAVDETEACDHVKFEKNSSFYDENGIKRKVAELCGEASENDSVTFIDASWVKNPAFTGAVIRNIVTPPENIMAKIEEANKKESYQLKDTDYLKAAAKEDEEIPSENDKVEEAPSDTEEPAEDVPSENTEAPETDTPELPEEPKEEDIKSWKSKIKQRILKEVSDDIAKELSGEPEDGTPRELETLDENLIQPSASLKQMWKMKKGWDKILQKTAGNLNKDKFERLKFGTYMLLNSSDMTALSNYGYNKRDFIAVMSCLDKCFDNPLSIEVKKAVAELNGTKGLTYRKAVYALQKLSGRKLDANELKKAITWMKLMDLYPEF